MTVCGGWSLVKHSAAGTSAITLWCRSWTCADCAPYRVAALKRMAMDGQPTTFLTLTVNPRRGQSPTERAQELSDALKILVKRARRKFAKGPIEYLAVFEETKKGEPHLHVLMRAPFLPQRWLSETMDELIEAPIVDIRRVGHVRNAARYVAKYVGKGPKAFASLKRYWSTPKYDLTRPKKEPSDEKPDSGWRVWREPLCVIADILRGHWRHVEWINETELWSGNGLEWRTAPPWQAARGSGA